MIKRTPLIFLLPFFISGCYAYKVFPKSYRYNEIPAARETAYILNPELSKELRIIQYAGLYTITNDSSCSLRIRLHPIKKRFVCGNGLAAWIIFLGQLPILMPDKYQYSFEEIRGTENKMFAFELQVNTRYWFWDMFTFQKNFKKQAGKVLAGNYYQNKQVFNPHP